RLPIGSRGSCWPRRARPRPVCSGRRPPAWLLILAIPFSAASPVADIPTCALSFGASIPGPVGCAARSSSTIFAVRSPSSVCRRLEAKALPPAIVDEWLSRRMTELSGADRALVTGLAEGSIGRALALAEAGGIDLYRDLSATLLGLPRIDAAALYRFADKLGR